jgi:P-type E1-E2 ATPase
MTTVEPRRQLYGVDGLWCGGCASGLERRIAALPGVRHAAVHFLTRSAFVEWDAAQLHEAQIADCVQACGYGLAPPRDTATMRSALDATQRDLVMRLTIALFFGMWSMLPALILYLDPPRDGTTRWWLALASGLFAVPVLGYAAADLMKMAVRSIRLRSPSFDLMIAIGIVAATLASIQALASGGDKVYFDAAVMLVTVLLIARLIDVRLRNRAVDAIDAIEQAAPEMARLAEDGARVAIDAVMPGTRIIVDAGAEVPIDGIVEAGDSSIDRAILTGESMPLSIGPGMRVPASALNLKRAIIVRTDRRAGDRDIDRIGGRVAIELAARRGPADSVERLAGWLSAIIPLLGILVALGWIGVGKAPALAIQHGLATMIVLCPCALVLARPLAGLAAVAAAATSGIRVVDPGALETFARVRTILFDKTGTLTRGQPVVEAVVPEPGWTADDVLTAAAVAEAGIDHPISRAILARAGKVLGSGERHPRGAAGTWRGQAVEVGTGSDDGCSATALAVRVAGVHVGTLHLTDLPREGIEAILSELTRAGVATGIASGDHRGAVDAIGRIVGIAPQDRHTALSPQDKADLIHRSGRPVAFVGDGVNDAPAFAAADVSLAVASAHPAAVRTAQIVLHDRIDSVLVARALGGRLIAVLRRLMSVTIGYNVLAAVAGAAGYINPATAAVLMAASSLVTAGLAVQPFRGEGQRRAAKAGHHLPAPAPA